MEYEPVIGLEVHAQLKCNSKMFTRAPYKYGQEPNTLTDSLVMGLPGALPVLNQEAIRKSIKVGMMFDCEIADVCKWDRKNYFYPDLPKGYQISQFDQPICLGGTVEIEMPGASRNVMGSHRRVQLTRIHLEEDVGKLTHGDGESLLDYNRAGTPLIEIVTEPDLFSADEVFAFLTALRIHMIYTGVSDCNMEKGEMRCDANISLRQKRSKTLGTKVEIKNMNSISGVRNGVIYEIKRQEQMLKEGKAIIKETRRWDAEKSITTSMRTKEDDTDYRYFPDPDLMQVRVSEEMCTEIRETLPELPYVKQERFLKDYDLPYTITSVLYPHKELSDYFEQAVKAYNQPKMIANLIVNDLLRELSGGEQDGSLHISDCKVSPEALAALVKLMDKGSISKQTAQDVLVEIYKSGDSAESIVEKQGLTQTSETSKLEAICARAIKDNPKPVEEFKSGKETAINALKGPVMKATHSKANPKVVDQIFKKLLAE